MSTSLTDRLRLLDHRLSALPDTDDPPPTTLHLLGRARRERDWQRLLAYFLDPTNDHGLEEVVLDRLLAGVEDRTGLEYDRLDLADARVATEVTTRAGRPDVVVWADERWFVCLELKVDASEGADQTDRYVAVESFDGIDLRKRDVPEAGHCYGYLAPADAAEPSADAFVHLTWRWIASEIRSVLADAHGAYPARTTTQLGEFADLIERESMSDYRETHDERVALYVEQFDAIDAVRSAFEDRWATFTGEWGDRLAERVDAVESVGERDDGYVPADVTTVDTTTADVTGSEEVTPDETAGGHSTSDTPADEATRRWILRQTHTDWSWLFPRDWWRRADTGERIVDGESPDARVGFVHRLDRHRDDALGDHELYVYLRNAGANHDAFYDGFADRFRADESIPRLLPSRTERTGRRSNVLEATYEIHPDRYEDFFTAYVAALAEAFEDHVVSSPALIEAIDRIYETTLDEDVSP